MAIVAEMEPAAGAPAPLEPSTAPAAVLDLGAIDRAVERAIAAHLRSRRSSWQTAVIGILAAGLIALAGVAYSTLRADMTAIRTEIGGLRTEMGSEIGGLRAETQSEIGGLRAEMREEFGAVRSEIGGLRAEMQSEIGGLRAEMREEFGAVRSEIGGLRAEMRGEFGAVRAEMREEFARVHMVLLDHTDRLARLEAAAGLPRATTADPPRASGRPLDRINGTQ